jgi:hypothetical protein
VDKTALLSLEIAEDLEEPGVCGRPINPVAADAPI